MQDTTAPTHEDVRATVGADCDGQFGLVGIVLEPLVLHMNSRMRLVEVIGKRVEVCLLGAGLNIPDGNRRRRGGMGRRANSGQRERSQGDGCGEAREDERAR